MLRFVDGFDLCDPSLARIKYNAYSATFDQDSSQTGRDGSGRAFMILNNAFGFADYYTLLDKQGVWCFHADFQVSSAGASPRFVESLFFSWSSSSVGTQLSLKVLSDGRLRLLDRSNTTLATTGSPIAINTWYTLEVRATFGGTGSVDVRINGATVMTASYSTMDQVDTLGFRWAVFGPPALVWDNFAVWDGQDDGTVWAGALLGRMRVTSLVPTGDVLLRWAPSPGPSAWAMVNDHTPRPGGSPDGDLTYIATGGSSQAQLFELEPSPCFGKVYAVALNGCMRPAGAAYPLTFHVEPAATLRTLGSQTPGNSAYRTYQVCAPTNPESGQDWTDAVISTAYWGVSASAAAPVRVTAVYLEKVTSLVPQPYDCGGGPYSF